MEGGDERRGTWALWVREGATTPGARGERGGVEGKGGKTHFVRRKRKG